MPRWRADLQRLQVVVGEILRLCAWKAGLRDPHRHDRREGPGGAGDNEVGRIVPLTAAGLNTSWMCWWR